MSLALRDSHTGATYRPDSSALASLEALRRWLALASGSDISPSDQVFLLANGKQAKAPSLHTELISNLASKSDAPLTGLLPLPPSLLTPLQPPPEGPLEGQELGLVQRIFVSRANWAKQCAARAEELGSEVTQQLEATTTIQRGLEVATGNLKAHVKSLQNKLVDARQWADAASADQLNLLQSLQSTRIKLRQLPCHWQFCKFLPVLGLSQTGRPAIGQYGETLTIFVGANRLADASAEVRNVGGVLKSQIDELDAAVAGIAGDKDSLITQIEGLATERSASALEATSQLLEEIQVVSRKIVSDANHVADFAPGQKSDTQALKMAQGHSRNHSPALREYFDELIATAHSAHANREAAAADSLAQMRQIARIEAAFARVNSQLLSLTIPSEAEHAYEYLSLLTQLPFVYGSLIIEAVRRREWSDRLKTESATIVEEVAGFREEEDRRRKRWLKTLGNLVDKDLASGDPLNFELNLASDDSTWPLASRDDISAYLAALRQLEGIADIVDALAEMARDLDRPSRRQTKQAQAFKSGSIHETASRGSFLLRGNDEVRALRDVNLRLEEDLKGQKSRVRKLEELLYKQQQTHRPSSVDIFSSPDPNAQGSSTRPPSGHGSPEAGFSSSPQSRNVQAGTLSRRVSVASRRASSGLSIDEKALARRIVTLEAELLEERQHRREETHSRAEHDSRVRSEIEESHSTKRDLLGNMEAQQREFADERRMLQDEIREQRHKIEEIEDEVDRILGSREHERGELNHRVKGLESALQEANDRRAELNIDGDRLVALHAARLHLRAQTPAPTSLADALKELEQLAEKASLREAELEKETADAKQDYGNLQISMYSKDEQLCASKEKASRLETELTTMRNERDSEQARADTLKSELDDARLQLKILRSKFAEGETGSGALKSRLEEQAARAGTLATELAQTKSHVNGLDFELSSVQIKFNDAQRESSVLRSRLEERNSRDRELTQRVVTVQDELLKLLDNVGLSVVDRAGQIVIQRTSKLAASSSTLVDSAQPPLVPVDLRPSSTLSQWMHAASPEQESARFTELMTKLSSLQLSTFSEAIVKLRRDVEWTGKKWKQEARNYRDKYHLAQSEAHDKIAYRSFKEGDLALFLPTRNQATRPWAAFNVGAPHFFLREQETHRLQNREWLVARINKVQERVVDLSKNLSASTGGLKGSRERPDNMSVASDGAASVEDDNPFELSDGLRWYLLNATEEKSGAPSTPGLAKSTVASAHVDVQGKIRMKRSPKEAADSVTNKINKSLESRRSSQASSKRVSLTANQMTEDLVSGTSTMTRPTSNLRPGTAGSRHSANQAQAVASSPRAPSPLATSPNVGLGIESAALASSPPREEAAEGRTEEPSQTIKGPALATSPASKLPFLSLFGTSPAATSPSGPTSAGVLDESAKTPTTSPSKGMLTDARLDSSARSRSTGALNDARTITSTTTTPIRRPGPAPTGSRGWSSLWSLDMSLEEDRGGSPRKEGAS